MRKPWRIETRIKRELVDDQWMRKDASNLFRRCSRSYERADFQLFNLSVVARITTGGLQELNCLMKRNNKG